MTVRQAQAAGVPSGYRIYPWPEGYGEQALLVREEPAVNGGDLADARPAPDLTSDGTVVTFELNPEGARKLASLSRRNINRQMVIIVDGSVVTAPWVSSPILRGRGEIRGAFTPESAEQLASRMRSSACAVVSLLPVPALET